MLSPSLFTSYGRTAWRNHWPFFLAGGIFLGLLAVIGWQSYRLNDGNFSYALDDAYIHMAIAKNFALHGVWGINADEFASASSSPLWTLLLAVGFKIFGNHELLPLVLNIMLGCLALWLADHFLRHRRVAARLRALTLAAVVLVTPLPLLVFIGMEHLLQTLLVFGLVAVAAQHLADPLAAPRRIVWTSGLALLAAATRYESLLVIGWIAVFALGLKHWRLAFAVLVAAAVPIIAYGAVSVGHGWWWLPNSVFIKNQLPLVGIWQGSRALLRSLFVYSGLAGLQLLPLFPWLWWLARKRAAAPTALRLMALLWLATSLTHLTLGIPSWFYRYEAYYFFWWILVLVGLWMVAQPLPRQVVRRSIYISIAVLGMAACLARSWIVLPQIPKAMHEIYLQQHQVVKFLQQAYPTAVVGVNDIGAVSYFGENRVIDLWGLGNRAVGQARISGSYGSTAIAEIAQTEKMQLAAVYNEWFDLFDGLPKTWIKVGEWRLASWEVVGGGTVSWYAVQLEDAAALRFALQKFTPQLPPDVQVRLFP